MNKDDLKRRTQLFGLRIIRLVESLPPGRTASMIGGQLVRCGTSVGANYRAACRPKSPANFVFKMGIVEEEADETIYRMGMLAESQIMSRKRMEPLMKEAGELVAITVASIKSARTRAGAK